MVFQIGSLALGVMAITFASMLMFPANILGVIAIGFLTGKMAFDPAEAYLNAVAAGVIGYLAGVFLFQIPDIPHILFFNVGELSIVNYLIYFAVFSGIPGLIAGLVTKFRG